MKGGGLGVPHLECLAARVRDGRVADAASWAADQAAIYGLGLGLLETLRYLNGSRPTLDDFESWIFEQNGGDLPPERIAAVNASVRRALAGDRTPLVDPDLPAPLDAEDLRFWEQNGYVVLRRAVAAEDCATAARALWDFLGMRPDAPDGWYACSPREGIWVPLVRHPAFDANRASARIRGAFAQLWGTSDLIVTVDRGGFNPPERPRNPFAGQGLHWDTSLSSPMPLGLQGILYLTDTPVYQGAFRCVPGFHRRIGDWLAALPPGANARDQDLSDEAVCVAGQAGDMVIWHAALPHGASPNRGTAPRLVQYITYFPPGRVDSRPWV